jgi:hypothetical protein
MFNNNKIGFEWIFWENIIDNRKQEVCTGLFWRVLVDERVENNRFDTSQSSVKLWNGKTIIIYKYRI